MALIKCKECGHEMSSRATECPYCGCPNDDEEMLFATGANSSSPQELSYTNISPKELSDLVGRNSKVNKKALKYLIAIILLIVLLFMISYLLGVY